MKKIMLRNRFHGSEVTVIVPDYCEEDEAWFWVQALVHAVHCPTEAAERRLRRVENTLCGSKDCQCGTVR